jgi:hypothetical protein
MSSRSVNPGPRPQRYKRWAEIQRDDFESGCLQNDAGGILNIGNVESLSIATAPWSC